MAFTLNISLPEQDIAFVEAQTQAGFFGTADEFFHQLLQDERARQSDLERMLLRRLQDEEGSLVITEEDWERGNVMDLILEHANKPG